jgi:hypothetical protein
MKRLIILILIAGLLTIFSESHEFDDLVEKEAKKSNKNALARVTAESTNCRICKNIIQNAKTFLEQRSIKVSLRLNSTLAIILDLIIIYLFAYSEARESSNQNALCVNSGIHESVSKLRRYIFQ